MAKTLHPLLRSLLPVLTICCLGACKSQSPEAQVKAAFRHCVAGIEAGDAAGATESLAPDFQGPEGLDKAGARLYLVGLLRREKVGVTVFSERVEVHGNDALQTVELLLTSKGGGLLPQDASRRTYQLRWRLLKGDWRLTSVREAGS